MRDWEDNRVASMCTTGSAVLNGHTPRAALHPLPNRRAVSAVPCCVPLSCLYVVVAEIQEIGLGRPRTDRPLLPRQLGGDLRCMLLTKNSVPY